mmetsp:Transcript_23856/g.55342  ORF Transcript_23856/g.55342 Transcript_23856/m.55342 type:complete len:214 (-) Transcript_23856:455-1096(-)
MLAEKVRGHRGDVTVGAGLRDDLVHGRLQPTAANRRRVGRPVDALRSDAVRSHVLLLRADLCSPGRLVQGGCRRRDAAWTRGRLGRPCLAHVLGDVGLARHAPFVRPRHFRRLWDNFAFGLDRRVARVGSALQNGTREVSLNLLCPLHALLLLSPQLLLALPDFLQRLGRGHGGEALGALQVLHVPCQLVVLPLQSAHVLGRLHVTPHGCSQR